MAVGQSSASLRFRSAGDRLITIELLVEPRTGLCPLDEFAPNLTGVAAAGRGSCPGLWLLHNQQFDRRAGGRHPAHSPMNLTTPDRATVIPPTLEGSWSKMVAVTRDGQKLA